MILFFIQLIAGDEYRSRPGKVSIKEMVSSVLGRRETDDEITE